LSSGHHDIDDDSFDSIHSYSPVEDFEIIRHEDEHDSYDYAQDEADVLDVQSHDGKNDQEPTEHDQEPTEHDQEPTDDSQNQQEDYNDQNDYQEDYNDQNDYQDDYNEQNDYQDYADNCSYDQYDQDDY
jgi:DNA-directed RNA polymerase subunit delta